MRWRNTKYAEGAWTKKRWLLMLEVGMKMAGLDEDLNKVVFWGR
jgi:hypothetical protein